MMEVEARAISPSDIFASSQEEEQQTSNQDYSTNISSESQHISEINSTEEFIQTNETSLFYHHENSEKYAKSQTQLEENNIEEKQMSWEESSANLLNERISISDDDDDEKIQKMIDLQYEKELLNILAEDYSMDYEEDILNKRITEESLEITPSDSRENVDYEMIASDNSGMLTSAAQDNMNIELNNGEEKMLNLQSFISQNLSSGLQVSNLKQ